MFWVAISQLIKHQWPKILNPPARVELLNNQESITEEIDSYFLFIVGVDVNHICIWNVLEKFSWRSHDVYELSKLFLKLSLCDQFWLKVHRLIVALVDFSDKWNALLKQLVILLVFVCVLQTLNQQQLISRNSLYRSDEVGVKSQVTSLLLFLSDKGVETCILFLRSNVLQHFLAFVCIVAIVFVQFEESSNLLEHRTYFACFRIPILKTLLQIDQKFRT